MLDEIGMELETKKLLADLSVTTVQSVAPARRIAFGWSAPGHRRGARGDAREPS